MDSDVVGQYKGADVYLIEQGPYYFIAFDDPENQNYWLGAINNILDERPDYVFTTKTAQGEIEIVVAEIKPLIDQINRFLKVIE